MMYRVTTENLGWRGTVGLVLGLALALGIVGALVVLAFGIAIILLPVIAVASLFGWWRWRKVAIVREPAPGEGKDGPVIEIDYHVVDDKAAPRRP